MASDHTKRLHDLLLNLSKIHSLLSNGLFIGQSAKILSESRDWVEKTHQETLTQFIAQPDCRELEPTLPQGVMGIQGAQNGY